MKSKRRQNCRMSMKQLLWWWWWTRDRLHVRTCFPASVLLRLIKRKAYLVIKAAAIGTVSSEHTELSEMPSLNPICNSFLELQTLESEHFFTSLKHKCEKHTLLSVCKISCRHFKFESLFTCWNMGALALFQSVVNWQACLRSLRAKESLQGGGKATQCISSRCRFSHLE